MTEDWRLRTNTILVYPDCDDGIVKFHLSDDFDGNQGCLLYHIVNKA